MSLDLDHVAIVTADLDRAERNFTRLGFTLTPRSSHSGPIPGEEFPGPWGSGNHCAMFGQGYLELLGITDPERFHDHITRRLSRYEGLHLIAFGTDDAAEAAADMRLRGVDIDPPVMLGRDVPFGEGTRPGRFAIAYLDQDRYPEADFIVIEQQTREVLWQPDLTGHANGAVSLEWVTVCVSDPAAFTDRMTPALGSPDAAGFPLAPGRMNVMAPDAARARFGEHALPADPPCVIALGIGVRDPATTRALLAASDVPFDTPGEGIIRIGPEIGCGAHIVFVPTSQTELRS